MLATTQVNALLVLAPATHAAFRTNPSAKALELALEVQLVKFYKEVVVFTTETKWDAHVNTILTAPMQCAQKGRVLRVVPIARTMDIVHLEDVLNGRAPDRTDTVWAPLENLVTDQTEQLLHRLVNTATVTPGLLSNGAHPQIARVDHAHHLHQEGELLVEGEEVDG